MIFEFPIHLILISSWFACVSFSSSECETSTCLESYNYFQDQCYFVSSERELWSNALFSCEADGGSLVSILNEDENTFLSNLISSSVDETDLYDGRQFWIGLNKLPSAIEFSWADESQFNYSHWGQGQPDNYMSSENCVAIWYLHEFNNFIQDGEWNDINCRQSLKYICKVQADCQEQTEEPNTFSFSLPSTVNNGFTSVGGSEACYQVALGGGQYLDPEAWQAAPAYCAHQTELYAARCCSDSIVEGWYSNLCNGEFTWTASELGGVCYPAVTWEEAESLCEAAGSRLCTLEEVRDGCAAYTGCGFDTSMVWTSSKGEIEPETSGTIMAGGVKLSTLIGICVSSVICVAFGLVCVTRKKCADMNSIDIDSGGLNKGFDKGIQMLVNPNKRVGEEQSMVRGDRDDSSSVSIGRVPSQRFLLPSARKTPDNGEKKFEATMSQMSPMGRLGYEYEGVHQVGNGSPFSGSHTSPRPSNSESVHSPLNPPQRLSNDAPDAFLSHAAWDRLSNYPLDPASLQQQEGPKPGEFVPTSHGSPSSSINEGKDLLDNLINSMNLPDELRTFLEDNRLIHRKKQIIDYGVTKVEMLLCLNDNTLRLMQFSEEEIALLRQLSRPEYYVISHPADTESAAKSLLWQLENHKESDPSIVKPKLLHGGQNTLVGQIPQKLSSVKHVLILLSPNILSNSICIIEMFTAVKRQKRILTVSVQQGNSCFEFDKAHTFLQNLDEILDDASKQFLAENALSVDECKECLEDLLQKPVLPFEYDDNKDIEQPMDISTTNIPHDVETIFTAMTDV